MKQERKPRIVLRLNHLCRPNQEIVGDFLPIDILVSDTRMLKNIQEARRLGRLSGECLSRLMQSA